MAQTYTLKFPIEGLGRKIETVELRRLKGKDMRAATKQARDHGGDEDLPFFLLARASGLDIQEVEELDLEDMNALSDLMGKSLGPSDSGGTTKQR